jgi:hypothetical protein
LRGYNYHFDFKLLTCNLHFATLQVAPGRILFMGKDPDSPRNLGLISTNIEALRTHLKDPDGNKIGVWSGDRFGCNAVTYTTPSWVENRPWVCLDEKEGIHVLAV